MSCGLVCARLLWSGLVAGSALVILHIMHGTDETFGKVAAGRVWHLWAGYGLAFTVVLSRELSEAMDGRWFSWLLLAVYLTVGCVTDSSMQMVYDFTQFIGLAGGLLALLHAGPHPQSLRALLWFAGIQKVFFAGMYGPADVGAFLVCSMYLAAKGGTLLEFLLHMLVTILLLGLVQLGRKNISPKGDLIQPVALFPYITVAFFLII